MPSFTESCVFLGERVGFCDRCPSCRGQCGVWLENNDSMWSGWAQNRWLYILTLQWLPTYDIHYFMWFLGFFFAFAFYLNVLLVLIQLFLLFFQSTGCVHILESKFQLEGRCPNCLRLRPKEMGNLSNILHLHYWILVFHICILSLHNSYFNRVFGYCHHFERLFERHWNLSQFLFHVDCFENVAKYFTYDISWWQQHVRVLVQYQLIN